MHKIINDFQKMLLKHYRGEAVNDALQEEKESWGTEQRKQKAKFQEAGRAHTVIILKCYMFYATLKCDLGRAMQRQEYT